MRVTGQLEFWAPRLKEQPRLGEGDYIRGARHKKLLVGSFVPFF